MKNSELQQLLAQYPSDLPIRFLSGHEKMAKEPILDFEDENILLTSETAHLNEEAPQDEWDNEDGKVELGDGQQFLLINPIIV
jgi:hypothetical protein